MKGLFASVLVVMGVVGAYGKRPSEYKEFPGVKKSMITSKHNHSHFYLGAGDIPQSWDWGNVNGVSYLTKSLNQHIPQYCGSCWAHGALSALGDRIKIARKAKGADINLSIQYILNCGGNMAGSCHGGNHYGVYQMIKKKGFVPYDSCLSYEACSSESKEGNCAHGNYECSAINTCRTCSTFKSMGGFCSQIDVFPNATVSEYGEVPNDPEALKREIYARGPVAAGINANEILEYQGGIIDMPHKSRMIDHIVSITGWGTAADGSQYWIVRNSWGEYWGEMGYLRIKMGGNQLGIEANCVWATPGEFTEHNTACFEDGSNCVRKVKYVDSHELLKPYGQVVQEQHHQNRFSELELF